MSVNVSNYPQDFQAADPAVLEPVDSTLFLGVHPLLLLLLASVVLEVPGMPERVEFTPDHPPDSGVIDPATAAALAPQRADAMDRCAARAPGGLLAVTGLSDARLEQLRADTGLAVAIANGAQSVILGGPTAALDDAERIAVASGAQCTRLRVHVASHTPWMREAAESFARTLAGVPFQAPRVVLFSNAGDRVRDAASARTALAAQIATTVRWDECMENVMARQVRCVLEIGPGQALARMWNQRYPGVPARACDDFRSVAAIAGWLNGHADR